MYLNGILFYANIFALLAQNFDNLVGYKDFTYCGYSKKYAHLSFDDGPNKNLNGTDTLKILDVLDELKIKSSFFLIGKNIRMHPYVAQEIVKRGHTPASHSWTHRDMTNINSYEAINDFITTSKLFKEILGVTPKYYRPPYGNINKNLMNEIHFQTGMKLVMWNVDLNDWRIVLEKNSELWVNKQLDYLQKMMVSSMKFNHTPPSMILLAHDIRSTQDMIRGVVNYIKSLGYIFVDLDTCYENWVSDKKPEAPCVNDFNNTDGNKKCTQLSSGLPLACIPNGNLCILNKCGSPGCGLSCDNRNVCSTDCKGSCENKMCGDDGCGNSCGMCGSECINGICITPLLPDISKNKLCRPISKGVLELFPVKDNLITLNYEITAQWDTGMVIVYTLENNYKSIDRFKIKIHNDNTTIFLNVYGAIVKDESPDKLWVELSLEYLAYENIARFTIEYKTKTHNPMDICCVPFLFEISCLEMSNICTEYKNIPLITNNSFNLVTWNILIFILNVFVFFLK